MDLKALKRIILARWWILVLAAVLAVVASNRLDDYREENLPLAEAVTWVTFIEDPAALERDEFESLLETQVALAQTVNSDLLNEVPGPFIPWRMAEVELEFDQNQIQFIGRGEDEEAAMAKASELRENFLAASSIGAGRDRINAELEELTDRIGELRVIIAAATTPVPLTPEELDNESRRGTISGQIGALQGHLAALTVELVNPIARSGAAIQDEMTATQEDIDILEAELAAIPTIAPPVEDAADLELLLTELQLQNLEQRWETLYQNERRLAALATTGDIVAQPPTTGFTSASMRNTAIAVFAVLLVVTAAIVVFERARSIAWTTNDLDFDVQPKVFTEVASRGLDVFERPTDNLWYLSAPRGRRKAAVQYLRSALEDYQNAVIGIQGTGVHQIDIHELAGDIAISVAVSGRKVLLLDSAFDEQNRLPEYGAEKNVTLAELLFTDIGHRSEASYFQGALADQQPVSHGLVALRAGAIDFDSADVLSTSLFESLLAVAQEMFDLVIVVGSEVEDPASHVVSKRVDTVVLLGAIGHSVSDNIEAAVRDFAVRNTQLLGVVMVAKRRNFLQRWGAGLFRRISWRIIDWVRSFREVKPVTMSGFEQQLDRFEVSDAENLSEDRFGDVENGGPYARAADRSPGDEDPS